jgi:hypothetical protein
VGDSDGCYVTTFDGPMAVHRALDYFNALKAGQLKVLREIECAGWLAVSNSYRNYSCPSSGRRHSE